MHALNQSLLIVLPGQKVSPHPAANSTTSEPRELIELRRVAERAGWALHVSTSSAEAVADIERRSAAMVLLWTEGMIDNFRPLLDPMVRRWPELPVFVLGEDRARPAQAALRAGAWGYVSSVYELEDLQRAMTSLGEEGPAATGAHDLSLETAERLAIKRALLACSGNVKRAAKSLGIARATLYRKMARFGLRS